MVPSRPLISQKIFSAKFLFDCSLNIRRGWMFCWAVCSAQSVAVCVELWSLRKELKKWSSSLQGPCLARRVVHILKKYSEGSPESFMEAEQEKEFDG